MCVYIMQELAQFLDKGYGYFVTWYISLAIEWFCVV